MTSYIHERNDRPRFKLDQESVARKLATAWHLQGRLIGRMERLGFPLRAEATLRSLTEEILNPTRSRGSTLIKNKCDRQSRDALALILAPWRRLIAM